MKHLGGNMILVQRAQFLEFERNQFKAWIFYLVSYDRKVLGKVNIMSPSFFICNMKIKLSTLFDNVYEVPNIDTCLEQLLCIVAIIIRNRLQLVLVRCSLPSPSNSLASFTRLL